MNMKAMIFAAGIGSRLRPLTDNRPKALVEVKGKPLLEWCIIRLKQFGIDEVVINVHHFASLIVKFLEEKNNFDIQIDISDESDQLLDTGGGLLKAVSFFKKSKEPVFVCNVDVLSNIDIDKMLYYHKKQRAMATLAIRKRETSRYLLFNEHQQLCGWKNMKSGEQIISNDDFMLLLPWGFSGMQIIEPVLLRHFKHKGKFSIIQSYLDWAVHFKILGYEHNRDIWLDVGKPETLAKAETIIDSLIHKPH